MSVERVISLEMEFRDFLFWYSFWREIDVWANMASSNSNQRRESTIWSYMTRNGDKAVCNLCQATIELGNISSTSNALRHLRSRHKLNMAEDEGILKQKKLKRALARLIILELLPMKVAKSPAMRDLIHQMDPTLPLPSYYSVVEYLNVIRRNVKESVCTTSFHPSCTLDPVNK